MPSVGGFDEEAYEAEEDLRALMRAKEVERNPSRKARARRKVQRAIDALEMGGEGQEAARQGFRKLG